MPFIWHYLFYFIHARSKIRGFHLFCSMRRIRGVRCQEKSKYRRGLSNQRFWTCSLVFFKDEHQKGNTLLTFRKWHAFIGGLTFIAIHFTIALLFLLSWKYICGAISLIKQDNFITRLEIVFFFQSKPVNGLPPIIFWFYFLYYFPFWYNSVCFWKFFSFILFRNIILYKKYIQPFHLVICNCFELHSTLFIF